MDEILKNMNVTKIEKSSDSDGEFFDISLTLTGKNKDLMIQAVEELIGDYFDIEISTNGPKKNSNFEPNDEDYDIVVCLEIYTNGYFRSLTAEVITQDKESEDDEFSDAVDIEDYTDEDIKTILQKAVDSDLAADYTDEIKNIIEKVMAW